MEEGDKNWERNLKKRNHKKLLFIWLNGFHFIKYLYFTKVARLPATKKNKYLRKYKLSNPAKYNMCTSIYSVILPYVAILLEHIQNLEPYQWGLLFFFFEFLKEFFLVIWKFSVEISTSKLYCYKAAFAFF